MYISESLYCMFARFGLRCVYYWLRLRVLFVFLCVAALPKQKFFLNNCIIVVYGILFFSPAPPLEHAGTPPARPECLILWHNDYYVIKCGGIYQIPGKKLFLPSLLHPHHREQQNFTYKICLKKQPQQWFWLFAGGNQTKR